MLWIIATLLLVMTIILLSGKGAFLIAGYNTSSKAEQLKYDEKKLCRVTGCGLGVITAAIFSFAAFGNSSPNWLLVVLPIVILADVIVMLTLCNTICKAKSVGMPEGIVDKSKHDTRAIKVALIITAAVLLMVGAVLFTGEIKTAVGEDHIAIDGSYWSDYQIPFDKISAVAYVEDLAVGQRTNGMGSFKLLEGHFRNETLGDYILYAYVNCKQYIVLETADGRVVLNAKTEQETAALYDSIQTSRVQAQ